MDILNNRLVADGAVADCGTRPLRIDRKLLHALFGKSEGRPRAAGGRFSICHGVATLESDGYADVFAV